MLASSRHGSFYKNTFWQYGLQAAKYLFPLILLPYLTRVLEPEGYAIYAYVVSFMTIARVFVEFGFNLLGTKLIVDDSEGNESNKILGAITEARIILSLIIGCVVFSIAMAIPLTRNNILYTMLAYTGVCLTSLAPDFIFRGREQMGPLTTRYIASLSVSTALTFILVHSVDDILWIPIFDIIAGIIALIWSFVAAFRLFRIRFELERISRAWQLLRESALYCVSNVASTILTSFTTLYIGFMVDDIAQVSYWSVGIIVVSAIVSLYTPITNSLYPHILNSKDFKFVKRMALIALPIVLIIALLIALFADYEMLLLGGAEYVQGSGILVLVSPVAVFAFYSMLFGWPVLGTINRVPQLTRTTVIAACFSVLALIALGLLGASSIAAICVVRTLTEAVLCCARFVECLRARRCGLLA